MFETLNIYLEDSIYNVICYYNCHIHLLAVFFFASNMIHVRFLSRFTKYLDLVCIETQLSTT